MVSTMGDTPIQTIPKFISNFETPTTFFYFLHVVNAENATLTVEVIGPNLTFTFQHSRALELRLSKSQVESLLERKTCGFSTFIRGSDDRHVLAWAESGHGFGKNGDLLDASPDSPVLNNRVWTLRVIRLGKLLGQRMGSPRDRIGAHAMEGQDSKGIFAGCHVELKLATHAVHTLLQMFDITNPLQNNSIITRDHLQKLQHVRWEDGTRPRFEIYFSRKQCGLCGSFVRALETLTGVSIKLCWRQRLAHKVYATYASKSDAAAARRAAILIADDHVIEQRAEAIVIEGEDAVVIEDDETDDDDETVCGDNLVEIASDTGDSDVDLIDLNTPPTSPSSGRASDPLIEEFLREMTTYSEKVNASPESSESMIGVQESGNPPAQASSPTRSSPGLGFLSP